MVTKHKLRYNKVLIIELLNRYIEVAIEIISMLIMVVHVFVYFWM